MGTRQCLCLWSFSWSCTCLYVCVHDNAHVYDLFHDHVHVCVYVDMTMLMFMIFFMIMYLPVCMCTWQCTCLWNEAKLCCISLVWWSDTKWKNRKKMLSFLPISLPGEKSRKKRNVTPNSPGPIRLGLATLFFRDDPIFWRRAGQIYSKNIYPYRM